MLNVIMKFINILLILFIVAFTVSCASGLSNLFKTNPPETDDLLLQLEGYIIMDKPRGGIVARLLPSNTEMIIRKPWGIGDPVKSLGGPDNQSRIAFLEDHDSETYSLKLMDMKTTKETEIFSKKRSSWSHVQENYGKSFSYSAAGGLVAFVRMFKSMPSLIPNSYPHIGDLEIVDTEKGSVVTTDIKALDNGLDWFPDGKRLVYVELIPRGQDK
ncbi:MAG: hypothetical protein K4571_14740 [Deltaproteobacteria bacterium]